MDAADPFDLTSPFRRADGLRHGLSPRMFRGAALRQIFRGVYVAAHVPDTPLLRARAALLLFHPDSFASHATAGRVYGVPLPTLADEHVTVTAPQHRRDRAGIRTHVNARPEVIRLRGVRVSGCLQMFVELATQLELVDLVVVGDNLVRREIVTVQALVDHCAASRQPGARRAARAAAYVRPRVDSPMETRLRMLLVLAGLPEPLVNLTIADANGLPARRYDLSYPQIRVIVEYDGRHHIEREQQWEADLERREAIDDDGWRLLVVTADGIFKHPDRTLDRVHRLLRARRLPGVPGRLRDDWRAHFPGRS